MNTSNDNSDRRWDIHTERQLSIAKAGALAVTVLNSGSWLALLSQASDLKGVSIGYSLGAWGLGALLGTLIWIIMFFNSRAQMDHDFDKNNKVHIRKMVVGARCGYMAAFGALLFFAIGVLALALVFL